MALFEGLTGTPKTFAEWAEQDVGEVFFNADEHAQRRTVDGKLCLIILEEDTLGLHNSHWEAGAKQNFDTGLYNANTILYIQAADYGPKPKVGKMLVLGLGEGKSRTYEIRHCAEEAGVYKMTLMRVRQ